MIPLHEYLLFLAAAIGLVLTPGPNTVYLISRAITQGHTAGLISLIGVAIGYLFHMLLASFGLSALLLVIPFAYTAVKLAGAAYLLWMAWDNIRPGSKSVFEPRDLPHDSPRKLIQMGLLTSALSPKIAIFYLALFPQFVSPEHGSVLIQSLILGFTQIGVSAIFNSIFILSAGLVSLWLTSRPTWIRTQKWIMASVLTGLAVRLAFDRGKQ